MNAQHQEVLQPEMYQTEASQTAVPQATVPQAAGHQIEALQRQGLQQQLVEAQDAYWSHVTLLSDMVRRLQRFGQRLFGVESLHADAVASLPDRPDLLAAIQQKELWALEITRLNALLGGEPDVDEPDDAKIVRLW